jgi:Zn-dependent protease
MLYNLPAIILALTMHEFMHAYVADRAGDPTPRNQGRLTINPLKHLDPIGTLMIIFIGFGWAKPVNVNIRNFRNGRRDFIYVSLAGVFANLILAFIATAILYFSGDALFNSSPVLYRIIQPFVWINLMLVALNIIPIPPLDGFNVLTSLVTFRNMEIIFNLRRYGFMIIILLSFIGVLGRYISLLSGLLYGGVTGLLSLIERLVGLIA